MNNEDRKFYEEYYSDWTVHELDLRVYVPWAGDDPEEVLSLVLEILNQAQFDIRAEPVTRTETKQCRIWHHWTSIPESELVRGIGPPRLVRTCKRCGVEKVLKP